MVQTIPLVTRQSAASKPSHTLVDIHSITGNDGVRELGHISGPDFDPFPPDFGPSMDRDRSVILILSIWTLTLVAVSLVIARLTCLMDGGNWCNISARATKSFAL
jgi:hypothetical protein